MSDFFFEIRSGEIPAQMQKPATLDLKRLLEQKFKDLQLSHGDISCYAGPRRLVAVVRELATEQTVRHEERRGPRTDATKQAIEGFLKSTGCNLDDLEIRETPKGTFYFLTETFPAVATKTILPDVIREVIETLHWPKKMTWSTTTKTWVRPIQGGCALFGEEPLEFTVSMNEDGNPDPILVQFNNITVGHRFMAPSPFAVKSFEDYVQKLHKAFVIVDQEERQKVLKEQLNDLCAQHNLTILDDKGLLDEVTGLVEWPVCLLGDIDASFMSLPPELLRTTMRVHQRYFSVHKKGGAFAPHFIVAANIVAPDDGKTIVIGNERVLKARLSDAAFFYEQDRKKPLAEHGKKLDKTVFHASLGTLAQKQNRLVEIIDLIEKEDEAARQDAKEAARLCKADLMSEMVFEFPELQGIIGFYYAKADGLKETIAQAIYDQYSPKGPSDALPSQKVSRLLALADRLDTLVGFFSVGLKPTGSKDPFALRRAALGTIRFLEEGYDWALDDVLSCVFDLYDGTKKTVQALPKAEVLKELELFFMERLKVYRRDQGYAHDYIEAVLSRGLSEPLSVMKTRLDALVSFVETHEEEAVNLFAGYKRATNILRKEKVTDLKEPLETLFEKEEEKALYKTLFATRKEIQGFLSQGDFTKAMAILAPLRSPIDAFFEHVQVNDERQDIRQNRLNLLGYIQKSLEQVADFSKIEG
ncbi:MAG: glycine--tRNA ligase subunit beta [Alphaproteobacteria bacterium]|nr:glycine--tRNA ligase subunit beta [Alphaproteobacteria bacterium]NCQ67416.1 glycine--tRNA ligase subunit beta [Alphaproteobacteria bacterium]NCT08035.1 glycine--tRNA ligase subunit beta [Alphaproteobacteria bacterium]